MSLGDVVARIVSSKASNDMMELVSVILIIPLLLDGPWLLCNDVVLTCPTVVHNQSWRHLGLSQDMLPHNPLVNHRWPLLKVQVYGLQTRQDITSS